MKGDFSRLTAEQARAKHYNLVLQQQGRVQLDADRNELSAIIAQQRQLRTIDIVGTCGAPIHQGGFQLLHPGGEADAQDLFITPGRLYVGGLLCETTPSEWIPIQEFRSDTRIRLDDFHTQGIPLATGQWIQVVSDALPSGILTQITQVNVISVDVANSLAALSAGANPYIKLLIPYSEQPDFPNPPAWEPTVGQTDLIYLDVWERHITAIEDPTLREVALGGPDTDTRSKIIAQVKILPEVGAIQCDDPTDAWDSLIEIPDGRLTTRVIEPEEPETPCELGESGGFQGLENQLYRVEIHEGGTNRTATFKWSRDNAAFAYAISAFIPSANPLQVFQIRISQQGRDEILKLKPQDWIEISGDTTDLATNRSGTIAQIVSITDLVLTLDRDVAAHREESYPKVRRWDTSNQLTDAINQLDGSNIFQLEFGVEIEFSGREFRTGDYWVFAARSLVGTVENLNRAKPLGVKHRFCKLGLVTPQDDGSVSIVDCRPMFPPLTELPEGSGTCCATTISPSENWWEIFQNLPDGQDMDVCFQAGEYVLNDTLFLRNLGHIKFTGAGKGTHIIVRGHESALTFENCGNIIIRDLALSSVAVETNGFEEGRRNGAVTIINCEDITIENVCFSNADADLPAGETIGEASCLYVLNRRNQEKRTTVNVRHSEFVVADMQIGLLIVNADIAHIEANRVHLRTTQGEEDLIMGFQGITIAGDLAIHAHIQQNTIQGFLQGIHLGFSNESGSVEIPTIGYFRADSIDITGNMVECGFFSRLHARTDHHAIFVGNSNSLTVNDNYLILNRGEERQEEFRGIEIIGHWGKKMVLRGNHLNEAFGESGIVVDAIRPQISNPLWLVAENVSTVRADDAQVIVRDNVSLIP